VAAWLDAARRDASYFKKHLAIVIYVLVMIATTALFLSHSETHLASMNHVTIKQQSFSCIDRRKSSALCATESNQTV
jgi:Mg2+/Co2+ transporter CorB